MGVDRLRETARGPALLSLAATLFALFVALAGCATTAPSTPESTATDPPATRTPTATNTPAPTNTQPPIPTATITLTPTPGIKLRVNVTAANFRAGPGTHYRILDVLPYDTELTVIGRTEDRAWLNVITGDGERGWLGASVIYYVDPAQSQQVETVSTAPPPPPTPVPPPTWTPAP